MNDFNSALESAKTIGTQVTQFLGGVPPKPRQVGPTYLEKGDIFRFKNVVLNGNLWLNNELSKPYTNTKGETVTPQVYFTIVELLDKETLQPIGTKQLYLGSLCKTVYGYSADSNGKPKKNGSYIVADGDVCKAIQNSTDIISGIAQFNEMTPIIVSDVHTIETKNFNAKEGESLFRTGSTFQLDKYVK